MPNVKSEEGSSGLQEQPQAKKQRRALNFSIESIMQQESPKAEFSISPPSGQLVVSHNAHEFIGEPSPSSFVSSASSVRSSPDPSVSSLVRDELSLPNGRLCQSPPTSISDASSEAGNSRASTPISPGGNPSADHRSLVGGKIQRQSAANGSASSGGGGKSSSGKKSSSSSSSGTWSKERGSTNPLLKPQICHDPRLAPFECHLDNLDLWHRFHPLDTEMIITKQGRRMFPPVRVTFSLGDGCGGGPQQNAGHLQAQQLQLNPREKYQVLMDILPYDSKRYRYAYHKSSWQQAGKADPPSQTKLFLHPDGPFTLEQLKRQVISFEKIKLTNNDANKHGHIVLNSMHKYQPRIHLVLWRGKESQHLANAPISLLNQETHKTFIFSETIFTAVTAYQNHSITKLKIDSNPFAKGFRDSSRLTDLELESMQDLMSEGQCPFSPPRAPPHGFPHFLFAAAQQSPGQMEDPASALLRERTIMALDSFLQQQQHNQQQHHHQSSGSPQQRPIVGPPQPQTQATHPTQSPLGTGPFGGAFLGVNPQAAQGSQGPPTSQAQGQPPSSQLEQLIMQQQQQLAAAAMAAAAAANHQQWFGVGGPLPPPPPYTSVANSMMPQQHRSPSCGAPTTPTGGLGKSSLGGPGSPVRSCQLSPIASSKQAAVAGQAEQQICFHGSSQGGAPNHLSGSNNNNNSNYVAAAAAAAAAAAFHPQHLQAVMAAHHQHQMAALSMQLDHHHHNSKSGLAGARPSATLLQQQQQPQQQLQASAPSQDYQPRPLAAAKFDKRSL